MFRQKIVFEDYKMKEFVLIIFLFYCVSIIACESNSSDLYISPQLEISTNFESEIEYYDCCESLCPCICCTHIPVQIEIIATSILSIIAIITPTLFNKSFLEYHTKHWKPPRIMNYYFDS